MDFSVENDPEMEMKGIESAIAYAEKHAELLGHSVGSYYPTLSENDVAIFRAWPNDYQAFRSNFPDLDVALVFESDLKNDFAKVKWREFMIAFDGQYESYNMMTLLVSDPRQGTDHWKGYTEENTMLVVRMQFYCIESARNLELFRLKLSPALLPEDEFVHSIEDAKAKFDSSSFLEQLLLINRLSALGVPSAAVLRRTKLGPFLTARLASPSPSPSLRNAIRHLRAAWKTFFDVQPSPQLTLHLSLSPFAVLANHRAERLGAFASTDPPSPTVFVLTPADPLPVGLVHALAIATASVRSLLDHPAPPPTPAALALLHNYHLALAATSPAAAFLLTSTAARLEQKIREQPVPALHSRPPTPRHVTLGPKPRPLSPIELALGSKLPQMERSFVHGLQKVNETTGDDDEAFELAANLLYNPLFERALAVANNEFEDHRIDEMIKVPYPARPLTVQSHLPRLVAGGHVIIDGFLQPEEVSSLFEELAARSYVPSPQGIAWVRLDQISWVDFAECSGAVRVSLLRLAAVAAALPGPLLIPAQAMASCYGPGAFYVLHRDNECQVSACANSRLFTLLLYANPTWEPSDGGELKVYPADGEPETIAPIAGRLVIFPSESLPHEVLLSHCHRYALSLWLLAPPERRPLLAGFS